MGDTIFQNIIFFEFLFVNGAIVIETFDKLLFIFTPEYLNLLGFWNDWQDDSMSRMQNCVRWSVPVLF